MNAAHAAQHYSMPQCTRKNLAICRCRNASSTYDKLDITSPHGAKLDSTRRVHSATTQAEYSLVGENETRGSTGPNRSPLPIMLTPSTQTNVSSVLIHPDSMFFYMHHPTDRIAQTTALLHQPWNTGWNEPL